MIAHCYSCFREERRDGDAVEVLQPGGARRPTVHPTLAAWRAIRDHDGVVVGTCPCGQPLIGEGPEVPWTLTLPDGEIRIEDGLHGTEGELTPEAVTAWVERHHRPRWNDDIDVGETVFALVTMSPLSLVFVLWLGAATVLALFLYSFTQRPGFG